MAISDSLAIRLDECDAKEPYRLYKCESPYVRRIIDPKLSIGSQTAIADTPTARQATRAWQFGRPVDVFQLSLYQMRPEGSNGNPNVPGFEIELRAGHSPVVSSQPLCIVQFQPALLFDPSFATNGAYDFNSFLLEVHGVVADRWDMYTRALDTSGVPGTARPMANDFVVLGQQCCGSTPTLRVLRNPNVAAAVTVVYSNIPVVSP